MKGQLKLGIIRCMRHLAILALVLATAFCAAVELLPAPPLADTEVTTNIPFAVSFDTMSRVNFTLSLDSSPTNGAEVAIGTDADGDGNLSLDEADFTVRGDGHHPGWLFVMFDLFFSEISTLLGLLERGSGPVGQWVGCLHARDRLFLQIASSRCQWSGSGVKTNLGFWQIQPGLSGSSS